MNGRNKSGLSIVKLNCKLILANVWQHYTEIFFPIYVVLRVSRDYNLTVVLYVCGY